MALLVQENKHWPLALAVAQGEPTLEMHKKAREDWDKWLSNKQPFHILRFFNDEDSLINPKGVGRETQDWMEKGAKKNIQMQVKSMIIVVPKDQYARLQKMSITKVFGVPGGIFSSLQDAFNWLQEQPDGEDLLTINKALRNDIQHTIDVLIKR